MDLNKLLSGKFLFAVTAAGVFAYASATTILNGEQVYGIIMLVVAAYFGRKTEDKAGG